MMAPVETWVVDTGNPSQDARQTSTAVERLAVRDSSSGRGVNFFESVFKTFRPEMIAPAAIAISTIRNTILVFPGGSANKDRAAIFGVSFQPRAKLMSPALNQWTVFVEREVIARVCSAAITATLVELCTTSTSASVSILGFRTAAAMGQARR